MTGVLTILNAGTAFSRNDNDIVADLARNQLERSAEISLTNTKSDRGHGSWLINAGPGGGEVGVDMPGSIEPITGEKEFLKKERHLFRKDVDHKADLFDFQQFQKYERNLKHQTWAKYYGKGMEHNVVRTLAIIDQWVSFTMFQPMARDGKPFVNVDKPPEIKKINLVGWSRGAVTCHMIAHGLANYEHQNKAVQNVIRHLPVAIFAFDPVPGGSPGGAPYKDPARVSIEKNVTRYVGIYSAHDTRKWFQPVIITEGNSRQIIMPGEHSTAAGASNPHDPVSRIAKVLCHRFLKDVGTKLKCPFHMSDAEIIETYADIVPKMRAYKQMIGATLRFKGTQRRDFEGLKIASHDFFVNAHHEKLFKQEFPQIHPKLFGPSRSGNVLEYQKKAMKRNLPKTTKLLQERGLLGVGS